MLRLLRHPISWATELASQGHLKVIGERSGLMTFMFHGIFLHQRAREKSRIDTSWTVRRDDFRRFIEYYLRHDYLFISPSDIVEKNLLSTGKYALITFDDGYFNNTYILDIIEEYNIPALFFVCTKNILEQKSFWWDVVYRAYRKSGRNFKKFQKRIGELLWQPVEKTENILIEELGARAFEPYSDDDRPFTQEELKDFSNNPLVTIGNHTTNHAVLTCYSEEEILKNLELSQNTLEDILGEAPHFLSYPCGEYNQRVIRAAQDTNFRLAFSTDEVKTSIPCAKEDNRYASLTLGRFGIQGRKGTMEQARKFRSDIYPWITKLDNKFE